MLFLVPALIFLGIVLVSAVSGTHLKRIYRRGFAGPVPTFAEGSAGGQ